MSEQGPVWVDEGEVDAGWAAPQLVDFGSLQPQQPRRSRWITRGVPALIVVAVLLIVWIAGGFKTREDRLTHIKVGEKFTNGAFIMTLDSATIQRKQNYDDKNPHIQEVVVHGTAKNIWTESSSPYGDWFAATNLARETVKEGNLVQVDYGDDAPTDTPSDLTPGLPAMPITIEFEFPDKFRADHLLVAMEQISYGNHSITTTTDEKTWGNANTGYFRVTLPVERLAAEKDY